MFLSVCTYLNKGVVIHIVYMMYRLTQLQGLYIVIFYVILQEQSQRLKGGLVLKEQFP